MSKSSIALAIWRRHSCCRCSAQKWALCRGRSMTAGPLQTLHLLPTAVTSRTPGDDGSDLDRVGLVEARVAGHERAVADHEMRLRVVSPRSSSRRLTERAPGTSISRRGLRSSTFMTSVDRHGRNFGSWISAQAFSYALAFVSPSSLRCLRVVGFIVVTLHRMAGADAVPGETFGPAAERPFDGSAQEHADGDDLPEHAGSEQARRRSPCAG